MASCCQHDNAVCSLHLTEISGQLPTHRPLYLRGKSPWQSLKRGFGGPDERSRRSGVERHMFCSCQQSKSYSSGRPACNPWVQSAARGYICKLYIYCKMLHSNLGSWVFHLYTCGPQKIPQKVCSPSAKKKNWTPLV